jgi:hypothetical protein
MAAGWLLQGIERGECGRGIRFDAIEQSENVLE